MRTIVLGLALCVLALAGCRSARPDDDYRAYYTTPVPPGAVVLPEPSRPPAYRAD